MSKPTTCPDCGGPLSHPKHATRKRCPPCAKEAIRANCRKETDDRPTSCCDCGAPILQGKSSVRKRCQPCVKLKANADNRARAKRRWATDPGHREKARARIARFRERLRMEPEAVQRERAERIQETARRRIAGSEQRLHRRRLNVRGSKLRIGVEVATAILAQNDGTCDCCGSTIKPRGNGWDGRCIDHRHDNGVVRGVLCTRCNLRVAALDLRFTDPELFRKLLAWSDRGSDVAPGGAEG